MPIKFKCEHCGQVLSVSSTKAGKGAKCPKCHQSILIPSAAPAVASREPVAGKTVVTVTKSPPGSGASPPARPVKVETPIQRRESIDAPPATKPSQRIPASQSEAAAKAAPSEPQTPQSAETAAEIGPPPVPPQPTSTMAPIAPPVETLPVTEISRPPADERLDEADDPFSQFVVYDDGAEIVYASNDTDERTTSFDVDRDALAVPRSVLYMQGVLLGVVALVCFALGVLVGGARSETSSSGPRVARPCQVSGNVVFRDRRQAASPDDGSVVILLPQESRPDEKAQVLGLRPDDPTPDENHSALAAIRSLGGDYARADSDGRFRLRVSDTGSYFVLFISRNSKRKSDESLKNADLAQLGRYFTDAVDLIGENRYRWKVERIQGDRLLSEEFN